MCFSFDVLRIHDPARVPARLTRFPGAECSNSAGAFPASDRALDSGRRPVFGFPPIELRVHTEQRSDPTTPGSKGRNPKSPYPTSPTETVQTRRPEPTPTAPTAWHVSGWCRCMSLTLLSVSYGQFIGACRSLRSTCCRSPFPAPGCDVNPNSLNRPDRLREYQNPASRYKG